MDPTGGGSDPPAAAMADLAGEAAMALSGLSALIGPVSAEPAPSGFPTTSSPLETLASIDFKESKDASPRLASHSDANVILASLPALALESRSTPTPSEDGDDIGDMDDDISGLLNLTQAAAHMRPVKKIPAERALKNAGPKVKAKKELRQKVKPIIIPKTKQLKANKPAKGPKPKNLNLRRLGELGTKSDKEKSREVDSGVESDGEIYPHMESSEFTAIFETILREAESNARDIRKSKTTSAEVFGEVSSAFVEQLCESLDLKSNDVFFDLGSGTGNVVCQVAAQIGCRCYGVEIRSDLHAIAERVYEGMKKEMHRRGRRMGHIMLTNADALTQPMLLVDATVVFLNNISFPESMQGPLEHFFTETLPHGSRLVTLKEMFPRLGNAASDRRSSRSFGTLFKQPCEVIEAPAGTVTWTEWPVSYFIYTVDREAWAAVTYAINRPTHSTADSLRASSSTITKPEKISPRPKKSSLSQSTPTSTNDTTSPFKTPASASSPPFSLQGPFQNPHALFCLEHDTTFPAALQVFTASFEDDKNTDTAVVSAITEHWLPQPTEPKDDTDDLENGDGEPSISSTTADDELPDLSIALETYQSIYQSPFTDYKTDYESLSALIGSELAIPGVSVDSILSRLETYHVLTSASQSFRTQHQRELSTLQDKTEAVHRQVVLDIVSVDRKIRAETRKMREERASKLAEIASVNVNARQLDDEWQRDWLDAEQLRQQLSEMEEKLEILAKRRHSAVLQLTHLVEDETEETLNYSDPNNFVRGKPIIPVQSAPIKNGMDIDHDPASPPLANGTTPHEVSLESIKNFLEAGNQFLETHGIEMPVPKKTGRPVKVDRRFGPRTKKTGAPSLNASTASNLKQSAHTEHDEEAGTKSDSEDGLDSSDHGQDSRRSNPTSSADADGDYELNDSRESLRKYSGLMGDLSRASRPKRVVAMTSPPPVEPAKRTKKPGQKSLDRKQLKAALMGALLASPDGKLSIVELRQACKDLPPFKDLREKQIERKVWDALSKAQEQFKHALPTPAERKAHAMGAGKAGLWSMNPKWKQHPPADPGSSDESDDGDMTPDEDIPDYDQEEPPYMEPVAPSMGRNANQRKRARLDFQREADTLATLNHTENVPEPSALGEALPKQKKVATPDTFPPLAPTADTNTGVHQLAFLASAMESLSD